MSPEKVRNLAFQLLLIFRARQQQPRGQSRFRPIPLFNLIDWAEKSGAQIDTAYGPWRIAYRSLSRRGRCGLDFIPIVRRHVSEVMVETLGQAVRLAGFLNWSGVPELTYA
jgi:hypothetical protein